MSPRVLMVAYHYPPCTGSSGIQRALTFSRYLPECGWDPIVLSAHPRAYEATSKDQMGDIPAGVPVHRAFALDTKRHLSIGGRYPGFLAIPDRWATWALGAIPLGLRLVRRYRPAAIWTTYPIATAHRIGYWLRRRTGLPWIADFRDSMTEEGYPSDPRQFRAFRKIERLAMEHAARVVFTTRGAVRMYRERYPSVPANRFVVLPNGYDEAPFVEAAQAFATESGGAGGPLTLVHSGILYPSERDPRPFFDALAELKRTGAVDAARLRIVLRATGHDATHRPEIERRGIADLVKLEPQVPYREALREMLRADGLLLLQASNCNHQVPAKVYEYFRARRPILALTDARGDTAAVLSDAGMDTIVPLDDAAAIARGLEAFLGQVRAGTAPLVPAGEVERHSRRGRTAELAAVLTAVSRPAQPKAVAAL
ncbi:MAG TPA: glycosyltransferase family 4 protein [Planctomycetota bacterium]|nr:glycosyltransferase family 4 protein [Planctomycetota bacterium]